MREWGQGTRPQIATRRSAARNDINSQALRTNGYFVSMVVVRRRAGCADEAGWLTVGFTPTLTLPHRGGEELVGFG